MLEPSQVFFLVNLFGFRKADGTRRFTTALYTVARKNAKSTLAAAILLYCLVAEGEVGPQVISAATTGDQARVVFGIAQRMVQMSPDLREAFSVEAFKHSIASYPNRGMMKPINAKASTQDGLNPSAVCLDEVHAHKTGDLLNVLKSAAGARRNPLFLFATTEGFETPGPWPELRKFAEQLLLGAVVADHILALVYALDEKDDDFDERAWEKANPLMHVNPLILSEMRKLAIEAKSMPGVLAEFRIKRLNRRAAAAEAHIDLAKWKACSGPVDLAALEKAPCFMGLDLASSRDMCAMRLVWRLDDRWLTWGRRWVPADAVAQRTTRGTVPYQRWVEAGLVEETPGITTDYAVIEAAIVEACSRFTVKAIAYDDWNAADLVTRLEKRELPLERFIQGPRSYHPAIQELDRAYVSGRLAHGGDEVLAWQAANLVVRRDENNNMAPSKKRAPDKIDDIAALLMAMGVALRAPDSTSVYDTRGILTL